MVVRGPILHQSRAAPGFDGVGSIRHRSKTFLRRWVGERNFKVGWSGVGGWVPLGCGRPCDHQRQGSSCPLCSRRWRCPRSSSSTEWWTFQLCSSDVYPQCHCAEDREIPQLQFLDKVYDTRCCTTTAAWSDRAENCGSSAVAVTRWTMSLLCRSSSSSLRKWHRFSSSPELWTSSCTEDGFRSQQRRARFQQCGDEWFLSAFVAIFRAPPGCPGVERQFSSPR